MMAETLPTDPADWIEEDIVLIVEDNPGIQDVLRKLVEGHGCRAEIAANGREVDRIVEAIVPKLMIVDIGLPEEDGLSVVERLRRRSEFVHVPVVILTGYGMIDDVVDLQIRSQAIGCREFINKPVRPKEIINLLRRYIYR